MAKESATVEHMLCEEIIVKLPETRACSLAEILSAIEFALPEGMSRDQRLKHVSYLFQQLRAEGRVCLTVVALRGKWELTN